jgi:hypothetical protein
VSIRTRSNRTFFILLALLALAAASAPFLPQGEVGSQLPASSIPAWQQALASGGLVLVVYGLLGFLGLVLWRRLGLPEIWEPGVDARQRFLLPGLAGAALGVLLAMLDLVFSRFNGIGRMIHPPFPTSMIASLSAGIGEEMIFRLFFISFWTWLVGRVILRGRGLKAVFWVVSVLSAVLFAASHLPSLMFLLNVSDPAALPPVLLLELLLMNGCIGVIAAWLFRRWGFFAPVAVHFWADVVWHVLWGLVS